MSNAVDYQKLALDLRDQLDSLKAENMALEQRRQAEQQACQAAERRVDALEEREVLAQSEGVLTFMRSDDENSGGCACCDGAHVFCRYFEGMERFDDLTMKARFRNDLEGRRFRAVLQLLPGEALSPTTEAASHDE